MEPSGAHTVDFSTPRTMGDYAPDTDESLTWLVTAQHADTRLSVPLAAIDVYHPPKS